MLKKREIEQMCQIFERVNPNPKIELNYINNFTLLIAIILSAQSTDKMVNRCTEDLFKVCKTPYDVLNMGKEEFIDYIQYIGMYRNKTRHIFETCHKIIKDYNGKVPDTFDKLIKLPGVGTKTANVFLNSAFDKPVIGVDRHILRIVPKIGIANGTTPDEIMVALQNIIPRKYHKKIHHWLVLHGRYICKAQKQQCENCPIKDLCKSYNSKNRR